MRESERKSERESVRKKARKRERESEKERGERCRIWLQLFLIEMTGALAPFSYLVFYKLQKYEDSMSVHIYFPALS